MLKDYFDWDTLAAMPIKNLMERIEAFRPRFQEMARRQAQERVEAELMQKRQNRVQNNLYGRRR